MWYKRKRGNHINADATVLDVDSVKSIVALYTKVIIEFKELHMSDIESY